MGRAIGYMLTWNTYGTWLQGDRRGWVKDGQRYSENRGLYEANIRLMRDGAMRFGAGEKEVVKDALIWKAEQLGQEVLGFRFFPIMCIFCYGIWTGLCGMWHRCIRGRGQLHLESMG